MKKVLRNTITLSPKSELQERLAFQYKALRILEDALKSDKYSRSEAFARLVDLKYKRTSRRIERMETTLFSINVLK